jgi:cytochrome c-type biogenesis protein CcmE
MRLRSFVVPLAGLGVVLGGVLAFGDLNGNLVYYLTPTEAVEQRPDLAGDRRFRLAGVVAPGSVSPVADTVTFTITDADTDVAVTHTGAPPQLFREGIEVVVEGRWDGPGFRSDTMLVKHDEEYYPPADPGAEDHP